MIRIDNVSKRFDGVVAVDGCSFTIPEGSITGLIGPNGAGKTTLFNIIAGTFRPTEGRIYLDGEDVTGLPAHRLFHRGLVRTFQIPREFARMTVLENLLVVPPGQVGENLVTSWIAWGRVKRQEAELRGRAEEVLDFLNLGHVRDELAGNLSGGQKKLLELGRTMMTDARVVLLDEPGAGVNRTLLAELAESIRRLNRERGYTFCIIEHDMDLIAELCDPVGGNGAGHRADAGPDGGGPRGRTGARGLSGPAGRGDRRRGGAGMSVLDMRDVYGGYGGADILNGVSMRVDKGEVVVIVGPNGAGKSTAMKAVFGLVKVRKGSILVGDTDVAGLRADQIVRHGVGYVPQTANVFPSLTVQENLELGAYVRKDDWSGQLRRIYELFPPAEGEAPPAGRHAVRRPAPDGRHGAGADAGGRSSSCWTSRRPACRQKFIGQIFEIVKQINSLGISILMVEQNAKAGARNCPSRLCAFARRQPVRGYRRQPAGQPRGGRKCSSAADRQAGKTTTDGNPAARHLRHRAGQHHHAGGRSACRWCSASCASPISPMAT